MHNLKQQIINRLLMSLNLNGFDTLVYGGLFDILAKNSEFFLIKVLTNVDSMTKENATNIKTISYFFSITPIIVSIRSNHGKLLSNMIYSRFGISVVAPESFEMMVEADKLPSIIARKGKHLVEIDTTVLKNERERIGISLESLAKKLDVSKKCLYEIEKGYVTPSIDTVEKLESFFKVDLKKPYEFKVMESYETIGSKDSLQKAISIKFSELEIEHNCLKNSIFKIIGKKDETIVTNIGEDESKLKQKINQFNDILSFTDAIGFFVAKSSKTDNLNGVPVLLDMEILELENYDDLHDLIKERLR